MNIIEHSKGGVKSLNMYTYLVAFSQLAGPAITLENLAKDPVSGRFSIDRGNLTVPVMSKEQVSNPASEKIRGSGHIADCRTLSKMALRRKYKAEADSHRNMKQRCKDRGAIVHPDFMDFASFLRIVGPIPAHGATLDRINNNDPEYAPGKVRWADKRTQNANKGDSLLFYDHASGKSFTTSQLSATQGVSADTIRKRRLRYGWSDAEIIYGSRALPQRPSIKRISVAPIASPITAAERDFRQLAEEYKRCRREGGEEAFLPTYEDCRALREECGLAYSEEAYKKYVKYRWHLHKPHLNYDNIPDPQKQLIADIDPEYVDCWHSRERLLQEIGAKL